ncbi:3',5'-cyclic-nucleotide phosphodiesterase [Hymenobacter sp. BT186]|uniref:3',5'-cyclic-nucleotide phosphodiesterase n=1 Tax=Hymenobacter telluris TaxID=2816474 RepID=A0A939JBJ0_9BACT|nr:3',5'-cyclic-nucleotide phosphodiesterase [Hymenobacter telluris]MBO0357340.1 3',5'-cyclic-nucleotide phosphodiesterase [Hymenobacter telluris]MBW3373366.1 3',5'-cyclic-nucleotide phosphodiesterase [Hymenobacter norwichensis]
MRLRCGFWLFLLLSCWLNVAAQSTAPSFTVVPLGVKGGLAENNLSAYLVAPAGSTRYVCLDAGTVYSGVEKAVANKVFAAPAGDVVRINIKAYLISHAHLDHVAGLLLNAPDDTPKSIYGLENCLTTIQNDYFNWQAWPNFGNGGNPPALGKYHLRTLVPQQEAAIENTPLWVQAFPLSHGKPYQSAAFLVRHQNSYLLYLGDTGADAVEQSHNLYAVWQAVQPLVKARQLKAIFIEASYPNEQPEKQLFGHLTPTWLMTEMQALSQLTGPAALRGLPVVVTHIKPTPGNEATIKKQLQEANKLQLKLVFPEQGQPLKF